MGSHMQLTQAIDPQKGDHGRQRGGQRGPVGAHCGQRPGAHGLGGPRGPTSGPTPEAPQDLLVLRDALGPLQAKPVRGNRFIRRLTNMVTYLKTC